MSTERDVTFGETKGICYLKNTSDKAAKRRRRSTVPPIILYLFFSAARHHPLLILLLRSQPAANMTLRFVNIQHDPCLRRKPRIDVDQTVRNVLVYRTFADPEPFCRLPHRRIFIYNVVRNLNCPLFDIIFHGLPLGCFLQHMKSSSKIYKILVPFQFQGQ